MATEPKPPTPHTISVNQNARSQYAFDDLGDYTSSARGLIAELPGNVLADSDGSVVFDPSDLDYISDDAPAPDSVNPSLWRQSQQIRRGGLVKVTPRTPRPGNCRPMHTSKWVIRPRDRNGEASFSPPPKNCEKGRYRHHSPPPAKNCEKDGTNADATLTLSSPKVALTGALLRPAGATQLATSGAITITITGDAGELDRFAAVPDTADPSFPIVTP